MSKHRIRLTRSAAVNVTTGISAHRDLELAENRAGNNGGQSCIVHGEWWGVKERAELSKMGSNPNEKRTPDNQPKCLIPIQTIRRKFCVFACVKSRQNGQILTESLRQIQTKRRWGRKFSRKSAISGENLAEPDKFDPIFRLGCANPDKTGQNLRFQSRQTRPASEQAFWLIVRGPDNGYHTEITL